MKKKPQNRDSGRPWRRVKYQSDNPFVRALIKLYGDLPPDQLVAKWKKDHEERKKTTTAA